MQGPLAVDLYVYFAKPHGKGTAVRMYSHEDSKMFLFLRPQVNCIYIRTVFSQNVVRSIPSLRPHVHMPPGISFVSLLGRRCCSTEAEAGLQL